MLGGTDQTTENPNLLFCFFAAQPSRLPSTPLSFPPHSFRQGAAVSYIQLTRDQSHSYGYCQVWSITSLVTWTLPCATNPAPSQRDLPIAVQFFDFIHGCCLTLDVQYVPRDSRNDTIYQQQHNNPTSSLRYLCLTLHVHSYIHYFLLACD